MRKLAAVSDATFHPTQQQPYYQDKAALMQVEETLQQSAPLVNSTEIAKLYAELDSVLQGERFLIQAGDCAERFCDACPDHVRARVDLLYSLASIWKEFSGQDCLTIGRMAGQYAKPRSADNEIVDGRSIPCFRGEIINAIAPTFEARQPDPHRMLLAYQAQATTYDLLKKHFAPKTVYTSHEALLLCYERALLRPFPHSDQLLFDRYASTAHTLWIGERTRDLFGPHLAFARDIANPIGIKISERTDPLELQKIIFSLNPQKIPGRITLISRMGATKVPRYLPSLIQAVKTLNTPVIWMCDPMHGNMKKTSQGSKTRLYEDIVQEILSSFEIHEIMSTRLNGLHLEITPDAVLECLGGGESSFERDLLAGFESYCDPRLNAPQASLLVQTIASKRF